MRFLMFLDSSASVFSFSASALRSISKAAAASFSASDTFFSASSTFFFASLRAVSVDAFNSFRSCDVSFSSAFLRLSTSFSALSKIFFSCFSSVSFDIPVGTSTKYSNSTIFSIGFFDSSALRADFNSFSSSFTAFVFSFFCLRSFSMDFSKSLIFNFNSSFFFFTSSLVKYTSTSFSTSTSFGAVSCFNFSSFSISDFNSALPSSFARFKSDSVIPVGTFFSTIFSTTFSTTVGTSLYTGTSTIFSTIRSTMTGGHMVPLAAGERVPDLSFICAPAFPDLDFIIDDIGASTIGAAYFADLLAGVVKFEVEDIAGAGVD